MGNREEGHLEADQAILNGSCQVVRGVTCNIVGNSAQPLKNGQEEALPVGSKNNEFNTEKLGNWTKRF